MRIEQFLDFSAQTLQEKVALSCDGQSWTFGTLQRACRALAHALNEYVTNNQRIAIILDNSVETVISIYGTLLAGCTFVVLSTDTKPAVLISILNDCEASALITNIPGLHRIRDSLTSLPRLKAVFIISGSGELPQYHFPTIVSFREAIEKYGDACAAGVQRLDSDPAAIVYTSGSTGQPKGVILSHLNVHYTTTTIASYLGNTHDDVILGMLPLHHTYGLTQLLTAFYVGATLILQRAFTHAHAALATIADQRVTGFAVVPAIAKALLEVDVTSYDLSSLRYITNAAAALPLATTHKLRESLPHVRLFLMYGLTECMRASFLPPDHVDARPTSVGRGLLNQKTYIIDEHGAPVPPGTIGELVISGPNVMQGYWRRPLETDNALRAGPLGERMLYTGDLFTMDEQGYLYFVSRKDDIVNTCGEKVSPQEIEEVLCSLPGVSDAAVFGVPDTNLGHALKAIIQLDQGSVLNRRELFRHCAKHLEPYKVPTFIEFGSIPKTPNGKTEKRKLK
jgi:long-chain acyl-CoA synthetase